MKIFHLYVELYMSAWSNFCPHTTEYTMKGHFYFLKQIQNNTHDEVQAGCLWAGARGGVAVGIFSQSLQWNEMVGHCKQNLTELKPFSISGQGISHRVELRGTLAGMGHHSAMLHTARPGSSRHTQDD